MDIDIGIYPYTDSFYTTSGAVCTGLGIPEEAVETTIGVFSAMTLIDEAFHKRIHSFPTQILSTEYPEIHNQVRNKLHNKYGLKHFSFGWPDLNLIRHAERVNQLSSIFLTHLDLLDDLNEIKVATNYERT